ncbi:hypothetical protein [Methylobacterium nigriterrae]|uniref:hypothetical protein n=1 Tax=Methylobacterium nigriterrae TaxID=3127512 RepID=UPI003013A7A7
MSLPTLRTPLVGSALKPLELLGGNGPVLHRADHVQRHVGSRSITAAHGLRGGAEKNDGQN